MATRARAWRRQRIAQVGGAKEKRIKESIAEASESSAAEKQKTATAKFGDDTQRQRGAVRSAAIEERRCAVQERIQALQRK